MTRRNSSLGFLGVFGRSEDLRSLDKALRTVDLHPAQVPDGVKLTIVNLMKDEWSQQEPPEQAYSQVAELFAYCLVGPDVFGQANGDEMLAAVEGRLELALERQQGFDADLVLLALHSRLVSPKVVDRFGLTAEEG